MEQTIESFTELTVNVTPRNRANLRRLKTNSIQSFQRWEKENELLYAMIEDESGWLSTLFPDEFITPELFFYSLEDGTMLCLLANYIQDMAEQYSQKTGKAVPGKKFTFHQSKKGIRESKLFHSRDNVEKFLSWCRVHGIPEAILFESNDVVLVDECRTGGREIVICLMEIARRCTRYEILQLPQLINLEREIDLEELNDNGKPLQTSDSIESHEDRSPIDSDSGVESVFDYGVETTNQQLMEFTDGDYQYRQDKNTNNIKDKKKDTTKDQKAPPSLLESSCPKTELDEKVCKIAKDYDIKVVHRLKEGKYIILGKTMFVRMLNDHLLVRIGGGWDTLEHYVMTHSPKPASDTLNPTTEQSESRSRKGSGVWSKLVDKVKKRESQPNLAVSPSIISKTPRPDSSPASYRLRDRFKKKLSVEEKDGKEISEAIQKIESSLSPSFRKSSNSPSFTAKSFFQLKSRFDRGRKNSRENISEKKFKRMEEASKELYGGIKEKEELEGGEPDILQEGKDDVLMSGNGETTTTTTTLIDFQESTFTSSFSSNDANQDDPQPNLSADDLLFGGGQPIEQTNVYPTESSSDADAKILFPSTLMETEQSETMTFSTYEEERSFGVLKEGEDLVENTETMPQGDDQGSTDDHHLLQQDAMTGRVEAQPQEPQIRNSSMDNVAEHAIDQADLDEPQILQVDVESTADLETSQKGDADLANDYHVESAIDQADLDEPQIPPVDVESTADMETSHVESENQTNEQSALQFESQSVVPGELQTYDAGIDDVVSAFTPHEEPSTVQAELQPEAQEEPERPEMLIDNDENVYKPDEQFTDLLESQPPGLDEHQMQETTMGVTEDVCRADDHFTDQVEHRPVAQEEITTQEMAMDNVENQPETHQHPTGITGLNDFHSSSPEEPQSQDVSTDLVEDVYRADEHLEDDEFQPAAQEETQTQDVEIDNFEILSKDHFTEVPAPDKPPTVDAPLDIEDISKTNEQLTEQVEHQPAFQEEPQTPEMSSEHVELQPVVPVENGITESMKPNEREHQNVESPALSPDDESPKADEPASNISQAVAVELKPAESAMPPSSPPKHEKAKTKTSKETPAAAVKQGKSQSGARPQSSRTSKAKPSATGAPTSAATKKPSSTKSASSTATSKTAPVKSQGLSKPSSSTTTKRSTTQKPSSETSAKPTTTSNRSSTTARPLSSKATTTSSKTTSSRPATASSRPATASSRTATASSRPATASSRHAATGSRPAPTASKHSSTSSKTTTTSTRPGVAKDKKPTRPSSASIANTKSNASKTRPQSAKPIADKTDGKVNSSLGKANGKTAASRTTTYKQTTTTSSTQGPKTITKTTRTVTSRITKTPTQQQSKSGVASSKPGSAAGTKPKGPGASARPKSPTKQPPKKGTTTKKDTSKAVDVVEPLCKASDNPAPQEVTKNPDVTTTVTERSFTEDGNVTTVREVTETVTTNGEQQLSTTVVDNGDQQLITTVVEKSE